MAVATCLMRTQSTATRTLIEVSQIATLGAYRVPNRVSLASVAPHYR
jgi:hypothetical protein